MSDYTAWCRIKELPHSGFGAPNGVASRWVGLTLPCLPTLLTCEGNKYFGIPQKEAFEILRKSVESGFHFAGWYEQRGYPQRDIPCFYIPQESAEFVSAPE